MYNEKKFKNYELFEENEMATIGERIHDLRKAHHLTQTEFGALFGIGKTTVSSYETGNSSPNDDIKIAICRYFDVSTDYLLGLTDERHRILDRISIDDVDEGDCDFSTTAVEFKIEGTADDVKTVESALKKRGIRYSVDSMKKKPSAEVSAEDVKVALFGGAGEVTDEMWDEVTSFVEYVKQKHKKDQD